MININIKIFIIYEILLVSNTLLFFTPIKQHNINSIKCYKCNYCYNCENCENCYDCEYCYDCYKCGNCYLCTN